MWTRSECELLDELGQHLGAAFAALPPVEGPNPDQDVLREVAARLRDNLPYFHPLYVGQMLKPPHPVARLAYALALTLNPNNHALDGGRASSYMEQECVAQIARMFDWDPFLGHLCGGGTMANLEALWIARELHPGQSLAASAQAHYTHARLSNVLGIPFVAIPTDARGKMDIAALEAALRSCRVGTVVATVGTTASGAVDPLPEILALRAQYDFRLHVDAAYGGYFVLASNLPADTQRCLAAVRQADSIVLDPHKHGLQPYGCGCVMFRDPGVQRFYGHDSPYTYFSSDDLHLGEISLECSRPGAAATALWATLRMFPLTVGGEFALGLEACHRAALALYESLAQSPEFRPLMAPELDIVCWSVKGATASTSSARARQLFEAAARHGLHLALASFPRVMVPKDDGMEWDQDELVCLRACAMKWEHEAWVPEITHRLELALLSSMAPSSDSRLALE